MRLGSRSDWLPAWANLTARPRITELAAHVYCLLAPLRYELEEVTWCPLPEK